MVYLPGARLVLSVQAFCCPQMGVAVPPLTGIAPLVQYSVEPLVTVKVIVPWLIVLLSMVDGTLTDTLALRVISVWPGFPITSNVCVLVLAGPTGRLVEADCPW